MCSFIELAVADAVILDDRYENKDIDMLVEGTIPQRRVLDLAPGVGDFVGQDGRQYLTRMIESSMEY
jgi:hydroxyacid-oxoacid transhydrogenase